MNQLDLLYNLILQQKVSEDMKKYQFKIQQFRQQHELPNHIQQWLTGLNIPNFIKQKGFKYTPSNLSKLDQEFRSSVIQYAIIKRFPSLLKNLNKEHQISLSQKIKQKYNFMNMNIMMNNDPYFYYTCVFLTKLTVQYLVNTFVDIQTDKNLESEIYIILVYVMIGLEVTTKNYEINHKKLIKINRNSANKSLYKPLISSQKLQSLKMVTLQKLSSQKITKEKKKVRNIKRQGTKLIQVCQQSYMDQFRETLKENLYVKVLPKLPKKKIKAWQFDYSSDKANAEKEGDEKKYIFIRQQPVILKPAQQAILTHQTSSSYDYFMIKNHETTNFLNKNTKISYRPQYVQNKKTNNKQNVNESQQNHVISHDEVNLTSNKKNWNFIINQIKSNILPTNKLKSMRSMDQLSSFNSSSKIPSHRMSQTNKVDNILLPNHQVAKENDDLTSNAVFFSTINAQVPEKVFKKQIKVKQLSILNLLRKQRGVFNESCDIRGAITKYSMFNINGKPIRSTVKAQ